MSLLFLVAVICTLSGEQHLFVRPTITPSPNPGAQISDASLGLSDVYDCLQKDNIICQERATGNYYCIVPPSSMLTNNGYFCTNKFTDKIFQHSIGSLAQQGDCPPDQLGEAIGAYGKLEFPHGKQKCSTLIATKCGGPSFSIDTNNSVSPTDYEIYWTEWDTALTSTPSEYIDDISNNVYISQSMAKTKMWARLDTQFEYTGLGTDHLAGYPGNEGACTNWLSFNCYLNKPDSQAAFARLRGLNYGLGKPTTGKYDVNYGGWHAFGGQGQSSTDYESDSSIPYGWKPTHWEKCGERFLLLTVVNKGDFFQSDSKVVIQIGISDLENSSSYLKGLSFATITMSILALMSSHF